MHPNRKFHIGEREAMAAVVRQQGFGTLVAQTETGLRAVHVPLLLEGDRIRFHISRGNALFPALAAGCEAMLVVNGPHAYVSPDWYGLPDRVPTWNYVAVELEGLVRPLSEDEFPRLLDDISDHFEARLAPKPPWQRDGMTPGRFAALVKAIGGFEMEITAWRGTAKIDQDKSDEVRARIADALDGRGETGMAALMRPAG